MITDGNPTGYIDGNPTGHIEGNPAGYIVGNLTRCTDGDFTCMGAHFTVGNFIGCKVSVII